MTRKLLLGLLLASAASVSVAGCEDRWGYYYGNGGYRPYICNQYSSCGSCTPVAGCGWCSFTGGGACLSSPSECNVNAFTWTWEPTGCAGSDAGAGSGKEDGVAPPVPEPEAGVVPPRDASLDAASDRK